MPALSLDWAGIFFSLKIYLPLMKRKNNRPIPDIICKRRSPQFSQICNSLIRSPDISGKAFKILCIVFSNKKGWKNYQSKIGEMMKEGESALETGVKELQQLDLIRKIRYRDIDSKKMVGSFWAAAESPGDFADLAEQRELLAHRGLEIFPIDDYEQENHPPDFHGDGNPPDGKPRGWKSGSKNINNKKTNNKNIFGECSKDGKSDENESSGNESDSEDPKPKKRTAAQRTEDYIPLANHLAKTVQTTKNIAFTKRQIKSWAKDIRLLHEENKISVERIKRALKWYRKNKGGQYIPVIESGSSLRSKFLKLEDAIDREKNRGYSNGQKKTNIGHKEGYFENRKLKEEEY